MITEKEIQATKLSPTKKDFYQIWNELLDTASKISSRWSPAETNESDPGIVLLKLLTGIADKLNYTIDKNILEAYMPSVTQEESMRKLCEMMGYNIKYYQSAVTTLFVSYTGNSTAATPLSIPAYTEVTNAENTITYVTTMPIDIDLTSNAATHSNSVEVIEGQHVFCTGTTGNLITIDSLDDNFRFYLPEVAIAENGIFIYNAKQTSSGEWAEDRTKNWKKSSNLNTEPLTSKCYKFGFDSALMRPYLQFPESASELFDNGIIISYLRTSGINGNVANRTLVKLALKEMPDGVSESDLVVYNTSAALNGRNVETINQAYSNYKKTIGTFDTLVTCRDYMNKIYTLMDSKNNPLVSNILVTDIRDDINRCVHTVSFDETGIHTKNISKKKNTESGTEDLINCFDLILYPLGTYNNLGDKTSYKNSFTYHDTYNDITNILEEEGIKNIAHTFKKPEEDDLVLIKNKLKLSAKITTNYRVNTIEESSILANVRAALYNRFNARNVDFGEEIPYDDILECIESADTRIKNVSLNEPELVTSYATRNNPENVSNSVAIEQYNKMVRQNVLAGKVSMFNYNTDFKPTLTETAGSVLPVGGNEIEKIETIYDPDLNTAPLTVNKNEFIKFRAPNLKTKVTYPAYVNYRLELGGGTPAKPATMQPFTKLLSSSTLTSDALTSINSQINNLEADDITFKSITVKSDNWQDNVKRGLFKRGTDGTYTLCHGTFVAGNNYGTIEIAVTQENYITRSNLLDAIRNFVSSIDSEHYTTVYKQTSSSDPKEFAPGYLVDATKNKYDSFDYKNISKFKLSDFFIVDTTAGAGNNYGLGIDAIPARIQNDTDYVLGDGESLYINYTEPTTDDDGNIISRTVKNIPYGKGKIIKPSGFKTAISNTDSVGGTKKTINDKEYLTLGTNEQIEIREESKVELKKGFDIYWVKNNEAAEIAKKRAAGGISADSPLRLPLFPEGKSSYLLQDGEYLFYTDEAHINFGYVGSGTEIKLENVQVSPQKIVSETSASLEEIAELGVEANINWVSSSEWTRNIANAQLTLTEYQYYTVSEHDQLTNIVFKSVSENTINEEETTDPKPYDWTNNRVANSAEWLQYIGTNYTDDAGSENSYKLITLPARTGGWQVATFLTLNVGPEQAQYLTAADTINITYKEAVPAASISGNANKNIAIKTNKTIQSTTPETELYSILYDIDGDLESTTLKYDFKVKQFEDNPLKFYTDSTVTTPPLNNYNNYWTEWSLSSNNSINVNVLIPNSDQYALWTIYCFGPKGSGVSLKTDSSLHTLGIYNNGDNNSWWANQQSGQVYTLKSNCINTVYIPKTCTITIKGIGTTASNIIFAMPDIIDVNDDGGINPKLNYQAITAGTRMNQLRADLKSDVTGTDINEIFYYNNIMEGNMMIDLNNNLTTEEESMSDPRILYDKNNICNKFVISEIDADYLKEGITLAKSSKLVR